MTSDPEARASSLGGALTCGYTGDGLRAWKQGSAGRTYFLYDGDEPVCEMSSAGAVTAVNTFGASGLLSRNSGGASTFYEFDPQGSTLVRLDGGGRVLRSERFDAFGQDQNTAATPDPWGFGAQWGGYTDGETGLVLCTHRFYDPSAGRFLTRDPAGYAGGIDLYAYTRNNPANRSDPLGLTSSITVGVGGSLGAGLFGLGGGINGSISVGIDTDGNVGVREAGNGWQTAAGESGEVGPVLTVSNDGLDNGPVKTVFDAGGNIGPFSGVIDHPIDGGGTILSFGIGPGEGAAGGAGVGTVSTQSFNTGIVPFLNNIKDGIVKSCFAMGNYNPGE